MHCIFLYCNISSLGLVLFRRKKESHDCPTDNTTAENQAFNKKNQNFSSWSQLLTLCSVCMVLFRPLVPEECKRIAQPAQILTSECSRHCRNGHCTPTGKCCCNQGWEGEFCRTGLYTDSYQQVKKVVACHNWLLIICSEKFSVYGDQYIGLQS